MSGLHDLKPMDDPRVKLCQTSLEAHLDAAEPASYDALMLDVDNGPIEWGRRSLYSPEGLARFRRVLKKDGLLLIWAAKAIRSFEKHFFRAGFWVDCHTMPAFEAHQDGKPKGRGRVLTHAIWEGRLRHDVPGQIVPRKKIREPRVPEWKKRVREKNRRLKEQRDKEEQG